MLLVVLFFICRLILTHGFTGGLVSQDTLIPYRGKDYIIKETIIVKENITLTVEPGVTLRFTEGCSMTINGALIATGTETSKITFRSVSDEIFSVNFSSHFWSRKTRLVDGSSPNKGRLEVLHNGIWGTVCDDDWTELNSEIACRDMGFSGGEYSNEFGPGSGEIWMDDVHCRHTDIALDQCSHQGYGINNCDHTEDVGLVCTGKIEYEFLGPKHPWHGMHFTAKKQQDRQSLRSSLVNVNIHNVFKKSESLQSSLSAAVVCNGTVPYVKNVTIIQSFMGVLINTDYTKNDDVLLGGISIRDCPFGIHVTAATMTPGVMQKRNKASTIHIENINVLKCFKAFAIDNLHDRQVRLHNIVVSRCVHGIDAKFKDGAPGGNATGNPGGFAHELDKIQLSECQNGILFHNPTTNDVRLKRITFQNCSRGLDAKISMFSRFTLHKTRMNLGQYGIILRSLNEVSEKQIDLCRSGALSYLVESPVKVNFVIRTEKQCEQKFVSKAGDVLYVYIELSSRYISGRSRNLTIIDTVTSKRLYSNADTRHRDGQEIIRSTGNGIYLKISSGLEELRGELYVFNRHATSGQPVLKISETAIHNYSENALKLSDISQDIFVTDLTVADTGTGISISKKTATRYGVLVSNMTMLRSSDGGIFVSGNNVNLTVLNCTFEGSGESGALFGSLSKSTMTILGNVFKNNSGAIKMDSFDGGYFSITNNSFHGNKNGTIRFASIEETSAKISGNFFKRNAEGAFLLEKTTLGFFCEMSDNQFIENTGEIIVNFNTDDNSIVVNIIGNTWHKNTGRAMIRVNLPDKSGANMSFSNNRLTENTIQFEYPLRARRFVDAAIIVHVQGRFRFHNNIIENPLCRYEFATQSRYHGSTLDGRFNWWGTKDADTIISRIFDFFSRNELDKVNFIPYLGSVEQPRVLNRTPTFVFANGNTIGGPVVQDVTLTKHQSPYLVTRDVIVYPNVTLLVESGVRVNVLPDLGFHVFGKMEIRGLEHDVVKFNIGYYGHSGTNQSVYPVRLSGGTTPYEGMVEVYYGNTWATICRHGWSNTNAEILCKQLGFQGYVEKMYPPYRSHRAWLKNFKCEENNHTDITSCPFEAGGATCDYYSEPLGVRCDPGYWRGIWFSDTAMPSQLTYAKFERGGSYYTEHNEFNFVLQFDAQRQDLQKISIEHFGANAINLKIPNQRLNFFDVVIKHAKYSSGIGIQSKTHSLSLTNSLIRLSRQAWGTGGKGVTFGKDSNSALDKRLIHTQTVLSSIIQQKVTRDFCLENKTVVSPESFVTLSIIQTAYSSADVECYHVIHTISEATISIYSEQTTSSSDFLSVSEGYKNPGVAKFNLSSPFNDVFVVGPGMIYLTYIRMDISSETATKIFILTSKGRKRTTLARGSVNMNNVTITACNKAVHLENWMHTSHKLFLKNCILKRNTYGIHCENSNLDLVLKSSFLKNNDYGVYIKNDAENVRTTARITHCFLSHHYATGIHLDVHGNLNISIELSTFESNTKATVYHSGSFNQHIIIDGCIMKLTGGEVLVAKIERVPKVLQYILRNNTFSQNSDKSLTIKSGDLKNDGTYVVRLQNNTFIDNVASTSTGIFDITFNGLVEISGNKFRRNKCTLACIRFNFLGISKKSQVDFLHNSLEDNHGIARNPTLMRQSRVAQCVLGFVGCSFEDISVNYNVFHNYQIGSELCVTSKGKSGDGERSVDARYNWWGTGNFFKIEDRIFSFSAEDMSHRELIRFLPAYTSKDLISFGQEIFHNVSVLGGFMNSSRRLTVENSPYFVQRDLTVNWNSNITIDPGVTLFFQPYVGLLVLGNIFAMGTRNRPIRFCSYARKCAPITQNRRCSNLKRTVTSNSGSKKVLEIFVENSWKYVCGENFDLSNGRVACRELGYENVHSFSLEHCNPTGESILKKSFKCSGHENTLLNCTASYNSCYRSECVVLLCKPETTWGNIRITSSKNDFSEGMIRNDPSILQNILIDNSGTYRNHDRVPSIQIINRSPKLKNLKIMNSVAGGIQIIAPWSLTLVENVTLNAICWSTGLEILGNRGTVVVENSRVSGSKLNALVIAPLSRIKSTELYYGLPSLCDCPSTFFVTGYSYLYLHGGNNEKNLRKCSKVIYSPENTVFLLRVLVQPEFSQYSAVLEIHDGDTREYAMIARFHRWNKHPDNLELRSSSNSIFLTATYQYLKQGFLVEINIVNPAGSTVDVKNKPEYRIVSNRFHDNEGPAILFSADPQMSSKVKISRNLITSSGPEKGGIEPSIKIETDDDDVEISNNFIHDNVQGGIHVNAKSSAAKCKILNNIISSNINGSESILADAPDDVSAYLLIAGNDLAENNLDKSHDLVSIKNFRAFILGNVFTGNFMRYVLNWDSEHTVGDTGICEKNTFSMNAGYLQTIVLKGSKKKIIKNYISNPGNYFEIAVFPNYVVQDIAHQFDARFNWWGAEARSDIYKRIRDTKSGSSLPVIVIEPYVTSPMEIFSKGVCPLGWTLVGRACYYYHGGSTTFRMAQNICKRKGSLLARVSKEDIIEWYSIKTLLKMRSFNESNISEIWADILHHKGNRNCRIFDGRSLVNATCDTLHPLVCRKNAEVDCPNSCFHNGICRKRTCSCNKGYRGEDCSRYHCGDVGNCGHYGTCIGPNQCRCKLGWTGRGCTVSYCPPLTSCKSCLSRKGCGWCDEQRRCLPGTAYRSDVSQCRYWFFYQCLSVGNKPKCSDQIKVIDCETRLCNETFEDSNKKTCQQCQELKKCFIEKVDTNEAFCNTWNETRCPQGFVSKDYSDKSRINNIVASDKLRIVTTKEAILYNCPAKGGSVIVTKNDVMVGKNGEIISSTQAGGILHKVNNIAYLAKYQLIQAHPAPLNDAVSYSDFNQEVPLQQLADPKQLEDVPDDNLLSSFMSGNVKLNGSKVHAIGNDANVYKSLGNEYLLDGDGGKANSVYLTITNQSVKSPLKVGDVVAGKQSNGFLENVVEVGEDRASSFIHTELAKGGGQVNLNGLKNVKKNGRRCLGGNNLAGLNIIDGKVNVAAGDTIIGRKSNSFLGKVINSRIDDNNVIAELAPVIAERNGEVVTSLDSGNARIVKRRRREVEIKIANPKFEYTVQKNVKVEGESLPLNVRGGVSFKPKAKVSLDISDFSIKSIGVVLSGKAALYVGASYNFGKSSKPKKKSLSYSVLKDKEAGVFAIELPGVGFVSGKFLFDAALQLKFEADAKASGSISVDVSSSADLTMGGIWRKGHGVENVFESNVTVSNFSQTQLDNGTASLSAIFIPTFKVLWPQPIKLKEESSSDVLKDIFDIKSSNHLPSFLNVNVDAPIKAYMGVTVCSEKCQDPGKNIEQNIRGGQPNMRGKLTLKLESFEEDWPLISRKAFETSSSHCISAPNNKPCCGTASSPGKVNPETKKCQLICSCGGSDSSKSGVLLKNGKCECDDCPVGSTNCQCRDTYVLSSTKKCKNSTCPDGSLRLRRSRGRPECPCVCADGFEREMTKSGSCPCGCTCPDGTTDTIASDGSCPCICRCKGFETSTTGPSGCKCENDRCPICLDDEVAVWVNRKCLCRQKYDCGLPPVCVDGRKGPNCLQPDCGLCKGCSGNGICKTSFSCESKCVCNLLWEGECCERRIPRRVWGDPHLETLDGVPFDYFGIGEFWDCKSVANDFGIQTRFYAFKGASLTGAVAIKAGASVVTITACSNCSTDDLPTLRVDGNVESLLFGRRLILANETVTLDVQKPSNESSANGTSFMVFAFQYKSGVSVSINVGYSPMMSRQYINVQFAPTASFLRKTEGICGFMDDDPSNDLVGPNGETYIDPILFTDSWRVKTVQQGAGLFGSWSWNSSNFHADDVMDEAYTDRTHKPIYSLDTLPREVVDKANASCRERGLKNNLLKNCIFDVAITNDTSFLEQQSLKLGCPNDCSGKGLCDNVTCNCLEGWSGEDCSLGKCGNCSRGKCEGGFCQCEVGWEGAACDRKATCYDVDNCTSPIHGTCLTTNKCLCNEGYIGSNCSLKATCYNVKNCSSHGVCVDIDTCKCDLGWKGTTCEELSCKKLGYCSGNGRCIAFDVCECKRGWTGPSCAIFDCAEVNHCSKNGQCVGPNECDCFDGYQGDNCNASLSCSSLGDCNKNGVCALNNELKSVCRCYLGFTGSDCSRYDCSGVGDCSGRGTCIQPNLCECNEGYEGESCSNFTCEKLNRCSGRGTCIRSDECSCNSGWGGKSCNIPNCDSLSNCSSNGTCIAPNKCECFSMYDGERCDQKIQTNLHSPKFSENIYNATVKENLPSGYYVLTVLANDSDHGRSGIVEYSLVDMSVLSVFTIDRYTGRIHTTKKLDYETLAGSVFSFGVTASDDGSPRRSTEVTVMVDVLDVNDNCPIFKTIPTSYNIPLETKPKFVILTVHAVDKDSGRNGQVEYSIDEETNTNLFFDINKHNGNLFVEKTLQPGKYELTIVARDLGDVPCIRETFLTIVVDAAILPKSSHATTTVHSVMLTPTVGMVVANQSSTKEKALESTFVQPHLWTSTFASREASLMNWVSSSTPAPVQMESRTPTTKFASNMATTPLTRPTLASISTTTQSQKQTEKIPSAIATSTMIVTSILMQKSAPSPELLFTQTTTPKSSLKPPLMSTLTPELILIAPLTVTFSSGVTTRKPTQILSSSTKSIPTLTPYSKLTSSWKSQSSPSPLSTSTPSSISPSTPSSTQSTSLSSISPSTATSILMPPSTTTPAPSSISPSTPSSTQSTSLSSISPSTATSILMPPSTSTPAPSSISPSTPSSTQSTSLSSISPSTATSILMPPSTSTPAPSSISSSTPSSTQSTSLSSISPATSTLTPPSSSTPAPSSIPPSISSSILPSTAATSASTFTLPSTSTPRSTSISMSQSISKSTSSPRPTPTPTPSSIPPSISSSIWPSTPRSTSTSASPSTSPRSPSTPTTTTTTPRSTSTTTSTSAVTEKPARMTSATSLTLTQASIPTSSLMSTFVSTPIQLETHAIKPVKTKSPIASMTEILTTSPITATATKFIMIDIRLMNMVFDKKLHDPSSQTYKVLKNNLIATLTPHFEKIPGFKAITSVRFKKGSVIAMLTVQFSHSQNNADVDSLRKTIINAADSNGNIGEVRFDIEFLERSLGKTTEAPGDTEDDSLAPGIIAIIVGAAVLIIILLVIGVCCCRKRPGTKRRQPPSLNKGGYDPVDLEPTNPEQFGEHSEKIRFGEHSV